MNYYSYFKDPVRTKETIDAYGWHHTGDIGQWLPNGKNNFSPFNNLIYIIHVTNRNIENYRQEKAHFQVEPRRIYRPREN